MHFSAELKDLELLGDAKTEIELYLDSEGLAALLQQLVHLKESGDHCHFMTPSWGGDSLSESTRGRSTVLVNHLRITLVGENEQSNAKEV